MLDSCISSGAVWYRIVASSRDNHCSFSECNVWAIGCSLFVHHFHLFRVRWNGDISHQRNLLTSGISSWQSELLFCYGFREHISVSCPDNVYGVDVKHYLNSIHDPHTYNYLNSIDRNFHAYNFLNAIDRNLHTYNFLDSVDHDPHIDDFFDSIDHDPHIDDFFNPVDDGFCTNNTALCISVPSPSGLFDFKLPIG